MHWEPDVGFDPGSPELRPGPKAGTKPLRYPGIPLFFFILKIIYLFMRDTGRDTEEEAGSSEGA